MTEEEKRILNEILEILQKLAPEAAADLRRNVREMMTRTEWNWLFPCICQADQFAWRWQGYWKQLARTYLLVAIAGGPPRMFYDQPSKLQLNRWLDELRDASDGEVYEGIQFLLLGGDLTQTTTVEANDILTDSSRDDWDPSLFTNPCRHREDSFCYIITALRPTRVVVDDPQQIEFLETYRTEFVVRSLDEPGTLFFDVTRYYLTDPEAVTSEVLSCSLISQDKKCLYNKMCFGLVLRVPKHNICAASCRDLVAAPLQNSARGEAVHGLSDYRRASRINDFLEQLAGKAKRNLPKPKALLDLTSEDGHNELIVLGMFKGQVTVTALFIKTSHGRIWQTFLEADKNGDLRRLMLSAARSWKIPIIPIPDDSGVPSTTEFNVWLGKSLPTSWEQDVIKSDSQALILARQDPIIREDMPNLKLTMGMARALLAQQLNISVFTPLPEIYKIYRKFGLTHHPDKTTDEDKRKKFVFVRGLLTLVEDGEKESGAAQQLEHL